MEKYQGKTGSYTTRDSGMCTGDCSSTEKKDLSRTNEGRLVKWVHVGACKWSPKANSNFSTVQWQLNIAFTTSVELEACRMCRPSAHLNSASQISSVPHMRAEVVESIPSAQEALRVCKDQGHWQTR